MHVSTICDICLILFTSFSLLISFVSAGDLVCEFTGQWRLGSAFAPNEHTVQVTSAGPPAVFLDAGGKVSTMSTYVNDIL